MSTNKRAPDEPDRLLWHVPPENQRKRIEVAYGRDFDGTCWERVTDAYKLTVEYRYIGHSTEFTFAEWQPWHRPPIPRASSRVA